MEQNDTNGLQQFSTVYLILEMIENTKKLERNNWKWPRNEMRNNTT